MTQANYLAPETLIDGYRRFQDRGFPEQRALYEELSAGQQPHTLIIACSDSRVDPAVIFDAKPGELFVVRNVANLVPPAEYDGGHHGVSAALEFAVKVLKVRGVVVMGHGQCGGVAACAHGLEKLTDMQYLDRWLDVMIPARDELVSEMGEADADILADKLELRSVRHSLERLKAFDFVRDAIAERGLELHGARYAIASGRLEWLTPEGEFVAIGV